MLSDDQLIQKCLSKRVEEVKFSTRFNSLSDADKFDMAKNLYFAVIEMMEKEEARLASLKHKPIEVFHPIQSEYCLMNFHVERSICGELRERNAHGENVDAIVNDALFQYLRGTGTGDR